MEVQTQMGYTVKDFIDSNNFPEMKLISDNSGINREIKGARIIAALLNQDLNTFPFFICVF